MSANRRRDKPPTPDNLARLLSEDQRAALRNLESFGYRLAFIRHAGSRKQEVMILQADGKSLALLDVNGELQEDPSLRQRDDGKNRSLESLNQVGQEPIPSSANKNTKDKPKTKFIV